MDNPPIVALSLTQPWATLMILGLKRWETRSWATARQGLVIIHAAKGFPKDCKEFAADLALEFKIPDFPTGVALGFGTLTGCLRTEVAVGSLSEQEQRFGDYSPGRFAFRFNDVRAFDSPVPAKGALGFWAPPAELIALVHSTRQTLEPR